MAEIKLEKRYPHSRVEDINDAFIRGYWQGYEKGSSNAAQELEKAVMKMLDKDINVRSKDEPQTDCAWK